MLHEEPLFMISICAKFHSLVTTKEILEMVLQYESEVKVKVAQLCPTL